MQEDSRKTRASPSGGFVQLSGFASEAVLSLVRMIVLSRVLPPDQLGVAISITLLFSLLEMSSDIGLERFVLRIAQGTRPDVERRTLHALSLARWGIVAALLVVLGPVVASVTGAAEASAYFVALAIGAVVRGFAHLGVKEVTSGYAFGADGTSMLAMQVAWTLAVGASVVLHPHYGAAVHGVVAAQVAYVVASHALSRSRWRLGMDAGFAKSALRFGLPFAPNAMSIAAKIIGDRLLVAALAGPATLSMYALTTMIALMPRALFLKVLTARFVPRLMNDVATAAAVRQGTVLSLIVGVAATLGGLSFAVLGEWIVALLFGGAYTPSREFTSAVALALAIKISSAIITIGAIAYSQTRLLLFSTAANVIGMAAGAAVLALTGRLELFVTTMNVLDIVMLALALHAGRGELLDSRWTAAVGALAPPLLVASFAVGTILLDIASIGAEAATAAAIFGLYCVVWAVLLARDHRWRDVVAAIMTPPTPIRQVPDEPADPLP